MQIDRWRQRLRLAVVPPGRRAGAAAWCSVSYMQVNVRQCMPRGVTRRAALGAASSSGAHQKAPDFLLGGMKWQPPELRAREDPLVPPAWQPHGRPWHPALVGVSHTLHILRVVVVRAWPWAHALAKLVRPGALHGILVVVVIHGADRWRKSSAHFGAANFTPGSALVNV